MIPSARVPGPTHPVRVGARAGPPAGGRPGAVHHSVNAKSAMIAPGTWALPTLRPP